MINFAQEVINSEYSLEKTRKILVGGLKRYERNLKQSRETDPSKRKPLHLSASYNTKGRRVKKMLAKSKWLKSKDIEKRETQDFHPSVRYDGDRYDQKNDQTGRKIHPGGRLCQDHGAHQLEQSDEENWQGDCRDN